jgi:pimeloyl-ACP methyl ester carboxylesterase
MAFAKLGEVELFYTDEGEGDPAMLFVHGYSCDSHDWMHQLPHFTRSHRVIAVDLRGHGRSSAPADGYDAETLAEDLAALIEHIGCGPVVAVGHSMGGGVITALAVKHPELVVATVCVDPSYLIEDEAYAAVRGLLETLKANPVETALSVLGRTYSPASPPHLKAWHLRRLAGVPGHVLYQAMAGGGSLAPRSASEPYLRARKCPVLSIYARDDRVALERTFFTDPRSRAFSWPGSGHWLHQERPAEFNTVVEEWLETIGAGHSTC